MPSDSSARDAEQRRNDESYSSEMRPSAEPFATSSIVLPSADSSVEDEQKPAAKEYASLSNGMRILTAAATATQSPNTTASSPASTQVITSSKKRKKGHNHENESRFSFREPFLDKLRLMLDNETVADSGSIQWLDGEDAFVILDQNRFEKDIIPKYFTPIIFQSFLRKLYRWGFKRITTTHAGSYKFASATFTRSPAPSTTLNGTVGPAGIAVSSTGQAPFLSASNDSALAMLLHQQSAANAQPNQLYLSLLAQLQRSLQPAVTQDNHLIAVLTNAIAQQTLPQIQMQQQINQNQTTSILQSLLAQQPVNQSVLHSLPSNAFSPAPIHNLMMSSLGPASQNPLASLLNRNQARNANASTPGTAPSFEQEQALSLLSAIQNSITATAASTAHQEQGSAMVTVESQSSARTNDPRIMLQRSQLDSSGQPQRRSVVLAYPAGCFSANIGAMMKVSTVLKSSQ